MKLTASVSISAEVPDYVSTLSPRPTTDADRTLGIKKGLFRWIANVDNVPDDSTFLLGPVDVSFPTGKVSAKTLLSRIGLRLMLPCDSLSSPS